MLTTGKMIYTIRHNTNKLPVLDYLDRRAFIALSLSGGIILWIYQGMSMLISAAKIANLANTIEDMDKLKSKKTVPLAYIFTTDDVILLPRIIADALLGEDK